MRRWRIFIRIQIIESILNKHIQAVHDSDAKSNDDKHDVDDEKILQQQTSKDESDAKSHDETIENDEVIGTEITAILGDTNQMMLEPNQQIEDFLDDQILDLTKPDNSTSQTVQEITKHISGNLHDF